MSTRIKLSIDDIGLITTFENLTRSSVKDCMVDNEKEKITFIVADGQAGTAIGKGGINIKRLEAKLKKRIEVLEFSKDPLKFIANVLRPIKIQNAYVSEKSDGTKTLYASVSKEKIGMLKSKIRGAKELIKKYFDFDEVVIQ